MLSGVFQLGDLLDGSSGGRSDTDHRSVAALEGEHGGVEHAGLARASRSDDDHELIVFGDGRSGVELSPMKPERTVLDGGAWRSSWMLSVHVRMRSCWARTCSLVA